MLKTEIVEFDAVSLIPLLLFPVMPFVSLMLFLIFLLLKQYASVKSLFLFFVLLSIYLGLINATKAPESDLIHYISDFENIKYYSFFEYILDSGKEPVFYIFNYITYYLTNGNVSLYIIILTVTAYCFFFSAIYKFHKHIKSSNALLILSIIMAAFLPQLFSLSAHITRQFLASSVLLYAMVLQLFYNKKTWILQIMAAFIHSTALFFIPLLYIKPLKSKLNGIGGLAILTLSIIIGFLSPYISNSLLEIFGMNVVTYALSRVESGFYELESLSSLSYILISTTMSILLILQYTKTGKNIIKNKEGFIHMGNMFFIYFIFIIGNIYRPEMAARFFFFSYFFFPFVFPLSLKLFKQNLIPLKLAISFSLIVYFFYHIDNGTWTYAPIKELIFYTVFNIL